MQKPNLFGRRKLYTDFDEITAGNVRAALENVLPAFQKNKQEAEYLYQYYKGNQPILERVKEIRPEINNKIVENHAYEIVTFKTSYLFGEPISYARRSFNQAAGQEAESDQKLSNQICELNNIMYSLQKAAIDREIAEWMNICGVGYRCIVSDPDTGIFIESLDPRNTGVCYSTKLGHKRIFAFQEILNAQNNTIYYEVYTRNKVFTVYQDRVEEQAHAYRNIPIIEYPANNARLGAFEVVIGLLDAINTTSSNRLDGIEQYIQSILIGVNVIINDEIYKSMRKDGFVVFQSNSANPSSISFASNELSQTETQVEVEHLYQQALIICGMPDRNGANRTTGDTGQAVILRDGWTAAEACAKDTQISFERAEKSFLKIALDILRQKQLINLQIDDITIKFSRNNTDNMLTKAQTLQLLISTGVHPEIAFKICGLFGDPNQAYLDSEKYIDNTMYISAKSNTTEEINNENTDNS